MPSHLRKRFQFPGAGKVIGFLCGIFDVEEQFQFPGAGKVIGAVSRWEEATTLFQFPGAGKVIGAAGRKTPLGFVSIPWCG